MIRLVNMPTEGVMGITKDGKTISLYNNMKIDENILDDEFLNMLKEKSMVRTIISDDMLEVLTSDNKLSKTIRTSNENKTKKITSSGASSIDMIKITKKGNIKRVRKGKDKLAYYSLESWVR